MSCGENKNEFKYDDRSRSTSVVQGSTNTGKVRSISSSSSDERSDEVHDTTPISSGKINTALKSLLPVYASLIYVNPSLQLT